MGDLTGKTAVITGAARGIGEAFAVRLAQDGAAVAAVDILDPSETVEKVTAMGGKAISVKADISLPEEVERIYATVKKELGAVQILVNNAGLHPEPQPFENLTFEYWRKVMSVNIDSMFLLTKAFIPDMKAANWGRIINLGSSSANLAPPDGAPYVTSKGAVVPFSRAVATEFGKHNITCNAISPNPVRTPGAHIIPEEVFQTIAAMQPVPHVMEPRDVVGIASFLCTDEAAFITGQNLHVDGGMVRGD